MSVQRVSFFAEVDQSKRTVKYPLNMDRMICGLGRDRVKITVQPGGRPKSQSQLGYYRGVVLPHVLFCLYDSGNGWLSAGCKEHLDYCHELMLDRFSEKNSIILPNGEETAGRGSTATMTTETMTVYVEKIRVWVYDIFGVHIPDPDPNWKM